VDGGEKNNFSLLWSLISQFFQYLNPSDVIDTKPITLSFLYIYNRPTDWLEKLEIPCGSSEFIPAHGFSLCFSLTCCC
jgi:hypothetical protein